MITWKQITDQEAPAADQRIAYGEDSLSFGELRLPRGPGPFPVVVVIHGGCWQSEYDLGHVAGMSSALAEAGWAAWTIEYRRIGDAGGGWPGTFEDVARGTDHLRTLARSWPLDLDRVVLLGHSAGGHLALWLAARAGVPAADRLGSPDPLPVRGVVALAAITDLRAYGEGSGSCNASVAMLLGGSPSEVPERYPRASPAELPPPRVPVRLVHGDRDPIVPLEQSRSFAAIVESSGGNAVVVPVGGAGHFDLIAPFSGAWKTVRREIEGLLADVP